jgi:hypothetical protein
MGAPFFEAVDYAIPAEGRFKGAAPGNVRILTGRREHRLAFDNSRNVPKPPDATFRLGRPVCR